LPVHPLRGKQPFPGGWLFNLLALGLSPFALELDNFFVDREKTPLGEDGRSTLKPWKLSTWSCWERICPA